MSDVKPRGMSRWKFVVTFLGLAIVAVAGLWLWGWLTIEHRWRAMESEALDLHREITAEKAARPVLRGEPLPGNAWVDYRAALEPLGEERRHAKKWRDLSAFLEHGANPEQVDSVLADHAESIAALRRGAGRTDGAFPYAWPDGTSMIRPGLSNCLALSRLVTARARLKDREAPELLLDLAQFSCDLARNAPAHAHVYGMNLLRNCLEELGVRLYRRDFSPSDLLQLELELEALDRGFPDIVPFEPRDAMNLAFEFVESPNLHATIRDGGCLCREPHVLPPWGDWRFAFSDKAVAVDGFRLAVECARRAAAVRGASWSQVRLAENDIHELMRRSSNPLKHHHFRYDFHAAARSERARIRLLRVAVHHAATKEILTLEDPFGGRLLHRLDEQGLRIWSVGRDGVDDGGHGDWLRKSMDDQDIVLKLGRVSRVPR